MRVEDVAVHQLQPVLMVAELRADHCRARIGRVDVVPEAVLTGDLPDVAHRVDGGGSRRAHRAHHHGGGQAGAQPRGDGIPQRLGPHGARLVHLDQSHVLVAGDPRALLE